MFHVSIWGGLANHSTTVDKLEQILWFNNYLFTLHCYQICVGLGIP